MHASPMAKRYLETVKFRGPPAGTGPIVFRALIKQVSSIKMPRTVPCVPARPASACSHVKHKARACARRQIH